MTKITMNEIKRPGIWLPVQPPLKMPPHLFAKITALAAIGWVNIFFKSDLSFDCRYPSPLLQKKTCQNLFFGGTVKSILMRKNLKYTLFINLKINAVAYTGMFQNAGFGCFEQVSTLFEFNRPILKKRAWILKNFERF